MTARRFRFDIRQAGKPLMLILTVWLVGSLFGYFFLTRPKVQEYMDLEFGNRPQREAFERRRKEVERRESFLAALQQAERDLETLRAEVLSTRNRRMVEVELELENLCTEFGIDLETVSFGNQVLDEEGLDKFDMVVPLEGGYSNLRKFLQAVEGSDKFLLVERVALGEGREGGVVLQLRITLTTYFDLDRPPEKPATSRRRARGSA